MNGADIAATADLIADALRNNTTIDRLPSQNRPTTPEDAQAIQDAAIARIGAPIGGWKAGALRPIRGAIYAAHIHPSPARLPARHFHQRGIEGEVAFLFNSDLPSRPGPYSRDEVAAAVSACVAIEIVDSRYTDFEATTDLERLADFLSSGGLVFGEPVKNWTELDLAKPKTTLSFDDTTLFDQRGGHGTGDPLGACVMLINNLNAPDGVKAGQIVTTGTYTGGARRLPPDTTARFRIEGLGEATVTFTP